MTCSRCTGVGKVDLLDNVRQVRVQKLRRLQANHSDSTNAKTRRTTLLLIISMCLLSWVVFMAIFTILMVTQRPPRVPYERLLYKSHVRADLYGMLQQAALGTRASLPPPALDLPLDADKVISCYYNMPNKYETSQLLPSQLHPYLCTHINLAFAQIQNKEISLDTSQQQTLTEVANLKTINSKLKILLSIGGAGNDSGFLDMVVDHASRKIFIKSIKDVLRNYNLDGIDLDWEFPVFHNYNVSGHNRERQHFSQLLREIKAEYAREKRDYLLTVAVAAPETIVDVAYDIDQLNMYADYVNVMTYDFHSYTKFTPLTGLNSPLYPRPTEQTFLATLNVNYTVHLYLGKGLDRNKIVLGIPTYGHSFSLLNMRNTGVGSPAAGFGNLGNLGFVNYPDICTYIRNDKCGVTIKEDDTAKVPFLYKDFEWVSYDNPKSVMEKAKYIKENELRGAMIYSLNADDFEGVCEQDLNGPIYFPLSKSVREALVNNDKDINNVEVADDQLES